MPVNIKTYSIFLLDIVFIPIAWMSACILHYESFPNMADMVSLMMTCPISLLMSQIAGYLVFQVHRSHWQFFSLPDLSKIIKATLLGIFIFFSCLLGLQLKIDVPMSVLFLYMVCLVIYWVGTRVSYRYAKKKQKHPVDHKRVLIVGGGSGGESLVRQLKQNKSHGYRPVAIVDDRRVLRGRDIHGVRIVGNCRDIPQVVKEYHVDTIIISIPSVTPKKMSYILKLCEQTNVVFRTVPSVKDLASGQVTINSIREIKLDDLLARSEETLDWEVIKRRLSNMSILVTGGGGSIGSGLCQQICELKPRQLIVIENNEYNLYNLEMNLSKTFPEVVVHGYLLSVTDRVGIQEIMQRYRPEVVLHVAAYKHVPLLESQPRAALYNNVVGTRVLAEEADKSGVVLFTLISTDKAVNPANVMGASKRITEIFCQNFNDYSKTNFITVRFGNVLGSAGSVIPLFRRQIEAGGPVTVTHPEITRFFMTIPEATRLILQATAMGKGGEIFVLSMGEPIKISELAEQMIRLSGFKPYDEIDIQYTGLRAGEKLFEELFHEGEQLLATHHEKILLAQRRCVDWTKFMSTIKKIERGCYQVDQKDMFFLKLIEEIVPEFNSATLSSIKVETQEALSPLENFLPSD